MSPTALDTPPAPALAPPATPNLDRLVARARRRMRVNRALATLGPALLVAGAVAVAWDVVSRVVLLPDLDVPVAVGLGVAVVVAVAVAAAVRIPATWAAWAADRWFDSRDRYATAVELAGSDDLHPLDVRQVEEAEAAAAGAVRFPAGPRVPRRPLALGAAAVLVAAGLAFVPNPQDEARAQRALEQAQVAEVAEELRETAEELRETEAPGSEELAARLDELAAELDHASLEEALEALAAARAELARELQDDLASQRTALAGLQQELAQQPLGAGSSVRTQFEDVAAALAAGGLSAEEQATLEERLRELAEALAGGQPELADSLRQAA